MNQFGHGIPAVRLLLKLAIGAVALAATGMAHAAKPVVHNTGYEIGRLQTHSLFWIDDTRLLFAGMKTSDMDAAIKAKEQRREERLRKLYLWDDHAKSVRFYADAQGLCVSEGVVRYQVRVDRERGTYTVREGLFGAEKEIERPLPSKENLSVQGQVARVRSSFRCKSSLRSELLPPAPKNREIVVLHEGNGYLDLGPALGTMLAEKEFPSKTLTLYQGETGKAIELPITREERVGSSDVSYSAYRRAYVLRPVHPRGVPREKSRHWPKGLPLVAYLLWADGRIETVSVPYMPSEFLYQPQPIKAGWVFGGGNFYKTSGLYLFDGNAVSKADVGLVKEIAVSPDGCKSAVAIQNKHLEMGTPINLKIFDFCKGER